MRDGYVERASVHNMVALEVEQPLSGGLVAVAAEVEGIAQDGVGKLVGFGNAGEDVGAVVGEQAVAKFVEPVGPVGYYGYPVALDGGQGGFLIAAGEEREQHYDERESCFHKAKVGAIS